MARELVLLLLLLLLTQLTLWVLWEGQRRPLLRQQWRQHCCLHRWLPPLLPRRHSQNQSSFASWQCRGEFAAWG